MSHHKQPEVLHRLARIEGHVRSIHKMVEESRSYADVAQQISAVRSALDATVQVMIDDLAEHCAAALEANPKLRADVEELQTVVARFH